MKFFYFAPRKVASGRFGLRPHDTFFDAKRNDPFASLFFGEVLKNVKISFIFAFTEYPIAFL